MAFVQQIDNDSTNVNSVAFAFCMRQLLPRYIAAGLLVLLAARPASAADRIDFALDVKPLLESAFLHREKIRLLLVALTYAWIVFGMFWVGMPYTLRDQIALVTASEARWRAATFAGLAYGALLVAGGLLVA